MAPQYFERRTKRVISEKIYGKLRWKMMSMIIVAVTSYGGHIFMESVCGYDVP